MYNKTALKLLTVLICVIMAAVSVCACRQKEQEQQADASPSPSAPSETEADPAGTMTTDTPFGSDTPAETTPPAPTETNVSPDPTPDNSAAPTPTPVPGQTAQPTDEPDPDPDPVTELCWLKLSEPVYCDLDFDGKPDKVEVTFGSGVLKLAVNTGAGLEIKDEVSSRRFVKGLINNFNTGDNRVEIAISSLSADNKYSTKIFRLNASVSGFDSYIVNGFVDSVCANDLSIHDMVDLMGSWECSNTFTLRRDSFKLDATNKMWTVVSPGTRFCTVRKDMLVGIYTSGSENITAFISPGEKMYPVASDLESLIDIHLASGEDGYITITLSSDGSILYSGQPIEDWFSDLIFWYD